MALPRSGSAVRSGGPSCGPGGRAPCPSCWHASVAASPPSRGLRRYRAGADLAPQGEPFTDVVTLIDGWLLLAALLSDGRRQILHIAVPGDVLVPPLDGRSGFAVQAATDAVVCVTPLAAVTSAAWAGAHPRALQALMTAMSRTAAITYEHLTAVGRRTARERVALLLVELYYRCRRARPADLAVRVPLTQGVIADALGLTSVHVNRTLKTLRADGLIAYESGTLRILDPDQLAAVACLDVETAADWLATRRPDLITAAPPGAPTRPDAWR